MHNQSLFVKIVIWFMVFLMSAGFAALVIAPFAGNLSLFGNDGGRGVTQDQIDEARDDIKQHDCDADGELKGKTLKACKDAYLQLGTSYLSLATPADGETEAPRDAQRNIKRAGVAYKAMYELDEQDAENAARYAGYLRDTGKTERSLEIFTQLVKAHPKNSDYLLQQAGAYEAASKLDQAIATYRLFIKRFPDDGQVDTIKDQIKALQDQQKEQAAGGAAAGTAPVTLG
jgi:tetratricopeptide (TPR) repeat protein